MNLWFTPLRRSERGLPLEPVQRYNAIHPYMERYPEPGFSYAPKKENSPFRNSTTVEPEMKKFARNVAALLQTAQDVLDQAGRLDSSSQSGQSERDAFMASVNRLLELDEQYFQLLDTIEPQQDAAYILSFEEFAALWGKKASQLLAEPPLQLIADEDTFHAYATYGEDKEKTWHLPHQGWLFQTYG